MRLVSYTVLSILALLMLACGNDKGSDDESGTTHTMPDSKVLEKSGGISLQEVEAHNADVASNQSRPSIDPAADQADQKDWMNGLVPAVVIADNARLTEPPLSDADSREGLVSTELMSLKVGSLIGIVDRMPLEDGQTVDGKLGDWLWARTKAGDEGWIHSSKVRETYRPEELEAMTGRFVLLNVNLAWDDDSQLYMEPFFTAEGDDWRPVGELRFVDDTDGSQLDAWSTRWLKPGDEVAVIAPETSLSTTVETVTRDYVGMVNPPRATAPTPLGYRYAPAEERLSYLAVAPPDLASRGSAAELDTSSAAEALRRAVSERLTQVIPEGDLVSEQDVLVIESSWGTLRVANNIIQNQSTFESASITLIQSGERAIETLAETLTPSTDTVQHRLLGAFDLDGDGQHELITQVMGQEWYSFAIWRRHSDRWVHIWEGGG